MKNPAPGPGFFWQESKPAVGIGDPSDTRCKGAFFWRSLNSVARKQHDKVRVSASLPVRSAEARRYAGTRRCATQRNGRYDA